MLLIEPVTEELASCEIEWESDGLEQGIDGDANGQWKMGRIGKWWRRGQKNWCVLGALRHINVDLCFGSQVDD